MIRLRSIGLVIALAALGAAPASADPYHHGPRPFRRDGFALGFALGPSLFLGSGKLDDMQGLGGDLNIRVGTTASQQLLWLLEFQTGGYLVEIMRDSGTETTNNNHTTLTIGGQLYVREVVWLRAGIGFVTLAQKQGDMVLTDSRRTGLVGMSGAGVDLFRRGVFAVDLEAVTTGAVFDGALVGHSALMLGFMWY